MAQILKDEILKKINSAGLEILAREGFKNARLQDVAKAADISTGNIYRYFKNKEALFSSLINEDVFSEVKKIITTQFTATHGTSDVDTNFNEATTGFPFKSFYKFRYEIAIMVRDDDEIEKFQSDIINHLIIEAQKFQDSIGTQPVSEEKMVVLRIIYSNFISGFGKLLISDMSEELVQKAIGNFVQYHMGGIFKFLDQ